MHAAFERFGLDPQLAEVVEMVEMVKHLWRRESIMHYRRDIDGLRAIAVLPVMLFHAGLGIFSGGFVGVDVFFVISGYLITSLLIEDIRNKRFSIVQFYERRVRRILPALYLVVIVCLPFAWLWMLPEEYQSFSGSLSIMVFLSNLVFMAEVDYFNTSAELQPLLHTWTLAVEEQYYVFFPPLLWLLWKGGKRATIAVLTLLVLGSLLVAHLGAAEDPERNFFFSPARFWEIGVGSLCAFAMHGRPRLENAAGAALGLALIAFAILHFDERTPFPSLWTLVPVMGTVMVIFFSGPGSLTGRLLASSPLVGIGLISYSAYLWHQPLFAFARLRSFAEPPLSLMLGLALLALALAWVTWRFIEQPFRRKIRPVLTQRKHLFGTFAGLGAIILGIGFWGHLAEGLPSRLPLAAQVKAAFTDDRNPLIDQCITRYRDPLPVQPVQDCLTPQGAKPQVAIIGDSHALAISGAAQSALIEAGLSSYALTFSACPALGILVKTDQPQAERCAQYQLDVLDYARASGTSVLIFSLRWPFYLHGTRYDNAEGGVETGPLVTTDVLSRMDEALSVEDPVRQRRVLATYDSALRALASEFAIVVIDPVPEVGSSVPEIGARCVMQGPIGRLLRRITLMRNFQRTATGGCCF